MTDAINDGAVTPEPLSLLDVRLNHVQPGEGMWLGSESQVRRRLDSCPSRLSQRGMPLRPKIARTAKITEQGRTKRLACTARQARLSTAYRVVMRSK